MQALAPDILWPPEQGRRLRLPSGALPGLTLFPTAPLSNPVRSPKKGGDASP